MVAFRSAVAVAAVAVGMLSHVAAKADVAGRPIGKDLAGQTCTLDTSSATQPPLPSTRTFPIFCGTGEPVGFVSSAVLARGLPRDGRARRDAIIAAAGTLPGGIGDKASQSCDEGQSLAPGSDNLLFSCVLAANGWPRIVVVVPANAQIFEATGTPASLPALEQSIASLSGHALSASETEGGLQILQAHFPEALSRAGGAEAAANDSLVELARLDDAAQNFAGAEAAYRRSLEIEERLFGGNSVAVGETLEELALQVSNQGRFDEAAGLFRRAEPIIDASSSASARARLASYMALDAANQRHYGDALKYAQTATQLRRAELGDTGGPGTQGSSGNLVESTANRGELAHSLRIEAMMALRLGDLSSAIAAADEALSIVNEDPGLPLWWRPDTVAMMADINTRLGRVVEAEREYRDALIMDQKLFGDTGPTAVIELKLGQFYTDQELYTPAVAVFRQALAILDKDDIARSGIVPDQIIPVLVAGSTLAKRDAQQRDTLQSAIFKASQLIGSDVTSRTVADAATRLAAGNPRLADLIGQAQDAQRQRDEARIELAAETAKSNDQRDPNRERKLAAEMRDAGAKADALVKRITTEFPDYSKFADPGPVELANLRNALRTNEAFLSFVIGQKSSFALLVTSKGLTASPLPVTSASLAGDVEELRSAFVPRLGQLPDFDLRASYELYRKLIGPFANELTGIDHLFVAPAGALASLPFAVLVTEPPRPDAARAYSRAAWLIREVALSQVPSARAFLSLRGESEGISHAPRPLLVIADPDLSGTGTASTGAKAVSALADRCRNNGPIAGDLLRALPPLHETANEARSIARLVGTGDDALLLGRQATEIALRAKPLDQYAILYFATHGLLPDELHCLSEPGLVLSPPASPARTTQEDGLLEASEIAQLKLNADLVVLSACNTAVSGGLFGGEALAGLADAFFNAGARTVLASHWEVPSLATVKLMTGIFERSGRAGGIAQSLRDAQLSLIADPSTAHPFNWGAFSVIGDGTAASALKPMSQRDAGQRSAL